MTLKQTAAPSRTGTFTLRELLEKELKSMYSGECTLIGALPAFIDRSASEELIAALEDHYEILSGRIPLLRQMLRRAGHKSGETTNAAIEGLLVEGENVLAETQSGSVGDACLILVAQKVLHYKMAGYGALYAVARQLGMDVYADAFAQMIRQEKELNRTLEEIADATVHRHALNAFDDLRLREERRYPILEYLPEERISIPEQQT